MARLTGLSLLGCVRNTKAIWRAARSLALCVGLFAGPLMADTPQRVVSINLCTDQLSMLLAAEGQLHSVSHIALDPRVSAMVDEAKAYEVNHGLAEEIYLMRPDLVVAGAWSDRATVDLLRQLDIPVAIFKPANSLDEVRERIRQMGRVLHRQDTAQAMIENFDARLATLEAGARPNPSAVVYYANGYTAGDNTLAGEILRVAGFDNAVGTGGYAMGRKLPLEILAMTDPDIVITARAYPGASRAEAILEHPVVKTLRHTHTNATMTDHDWVCGTPHVLRAIEHLVTARQDITGQAE